MITDIQGLHHVTSLASDPRVIDHFWTTVLGLRRIKQTVNFDHPSVYHLYYGDGSGTPGSVMTYFPFPGMTEGERGSGEVSVTLLSVPPGALPFWTARLTAHEVGGLEQDDFFGSPRLLFDGPDGDRFGLCETPEDPRTPWTTAEISDQVAIRGFSGAAMRLADGDETGELLQFMGYTAGDRHGDVRQYLREGGNAANRLFIETAGPVIRAGQGAGSVHHIAFAVEDEAAHLHVRQALLDTGYQVTPVIDRDYFRAIYFRTPGGVLFEVATHDPGFDRDEPKARLGESLKLPVQHAHLRAELERKLAPLD